MSWSADRVCPSAHDASLCDSTLRSALIAADWSKLVASRQPGDPDADLVSYRGGFSAPGGTASGRWDGGARLDRADRRQRLLDAIAEHPDVVADALEDYGIDADDILSAAWQ